MTTPSVTVPGLGRIDYTSPASLTVALGAVVTIINTLIGHDLGVSAYVAPGGYILAAVGSVGWLAESIVKQHPRSATAVVTDVQHFEPLVRSILSELHAAEKALPAGAKAEVAKAEAAVASKLKRPAPTKAVAKATPPAS